MSADNNSLGDSAELGAATIVRRFGGHVSFPFGDNAKYDMIVDIGNSLYRVQVKTAHQRDGEEGSVRAPLKHESGYGYDTVDAYVLYNPLDDEYYWLWPEQCARTVARVTTESRSDVHPPNRERATFSMDVLLSDRLDELQN